MYQIEVLNINKGDDIYEKQTSKDDFLINGSCLFLCIGMTALSESTYVSKYDYSAGEGDNYEKYWYAWKNEAKVVDDEVDKIYNTLNLSTKDVVHQYLAIYQYLATHMVYDAEYVETGRSKHSMLYNALIVGKGACSEYKAAFMILCNNAPTGQLKATSVGTSSHTWNLVEFNGKWYHCDASIHTAYQGVSDFMTNGENMYEPTFSSKSEETKFWKEHPLTSSDLDYAAYGIVPFNDRTNGWLQITNYNFVGQDVEEYVKSDCLKTTINLPKNDNVVAYYFVERQGNGSSNIPSQWTLPGLVSEGPGYSISGSFTFEMRPRSVDTEPKTNFKWYIVGIDENYKCVFISENIEPYLYETTGSHTKGSTVSHTDASCTAAEKTVYKCSTCNQNYTVTGKKLAHSGKFVETVAPTCSDSGYDLYHCNSCGNEYKTNTVAATGHKYVSDITPGKVAFSGSTSKGTKGTIVKICSVCSATQQVEIPKVKSVSLEKTKLVYNGKVRKPKVIVKDENGKTISSSNYTVTRQVAKNVGTYTVTINFKNNYSGKITRRFTINPKSTSVKSVVGKSRRFTVSWSRVSTQASGYQIRYSGNSSMSGSKYITVGKNTTTAKTISKLKAKKKYYVQVRTYKTVGGTKYYSAWSAKKAVTTRR